MSNILLILFILSVETFSQSKQEYANIGNLELVSGDILYNCKIGYRTFGQINEDSSNVIIYPTWFEGTTEGIARLIEKYSFIDTTKYFIIAIDALGDGVSSSPSNYYDSVVKGFPDFSIRDMVNSQYKLVTQIFGVRHLFAAVGGSLGGIQVLEWAVAYPAFISKIVSYVGTPRMSTYDLLWLNTQLNIIEMCKRNSVSDNEIRESLAMIMAGLSRTPDYMIEKTKHEDFTNYLLSFNKEYSQSFTLEDYLFQLKAIIQHDISKDFNGSIEEAAYKVKAKLLMIISENDLLVNSTEAKYFASLTHSRTLYLKNNCGHLAVSCEIAKCREEIAKFLDE